ncbi:MAG: acyl-CoA thioesterase/BAAT N-terminal domain-containing protein [Anaerolineales bacterium]|nr:acyl-CoA thioesterase/BAAT N-terminal domain-containing protein [Anaerolineales bacterium]
MNLTVNPSHSLVDEEISLVLSGLKPGQPVTVSACVEEYELSSFATFVAGENGEVNLGKQAPVSGSYDWCDSMGLVWTLKPGESKQHELQSFSFSEKPHTLIFSSTTDGETAVVSVERAWLSSGVRRIPVDHRELCGVLFMPPGQGPFPGILVLTGSGGGADEQTAALLANHGYAALALAYFAYPGRPDFLMDIPLEYFEKGLEWLAANPRVDRERLGVTGSSRGGELSLQLGAIFSQIKTVVAYVPSSVRWGGLDDKRSPSRPAWTVGGVGLPFVQFGSGTDYYASYGDDPIPLTPGFLAAMDDNVLANAAAIEVEKTNGAIMCISGDDDQMWPSSYFSRQVMNRLGEHGFSHPYEHLSYAGAGHSILKPYIPLRPSAIIHPVDHHLYALGGRPQPQAYANEDSWYKVLAFLKENLSRKR